MVGSVGWFAYALLSIYPKISAYDGCEVNKFAAEISNREWGTTISAGSFDQFTPTRQYDLAVLLDVIEHTWTPWDDMKKIAGMVRPGGALLLKTFLEDMDPQRTMEAPPFHAHHFTTPVLRKMIEKVGFEIKEWINEDVQVIVVAVRK
jgi:2-polyprenyl-3-methyl-5-hydroxy-6-metoxy-1,4-benzoquinol methylase